MIYLDNAATTKIDPEVLDAMMPYLTEQYGNAGTLYKLGRDAAEAVQKARGQVASMFSCQPDNIIFTSGGSEGNNTVLKGVAAKLKEAGKTNIVVSAIEHDSVIRAAESLTKDGFYITYVKPDAEGCITFEAVEGAVTPATGIVSVMFANNEIGSVSDVKAIGEMCRKKGILFHCDCVQAAGQFNLDVENNMIDFATVSSHKIHGPKGIGALYVRDKNLISPLIHGGHEQEYGLRGGTENVAGIVGFGKACELVAEGLTDHILKVSTLKQDFVKALADAMPGDRLSENGIYANGYTYLNPGKVLSLRIDGVFGESLVLEMDNFGVCISAGSACRSHEAEPSHVLRALGLNDIKARSSVRVSFSRFNTKEEVEQAAVIMAECIQTLRSIQEVTAQEETEMERAFDGGEEV